MDQCTKAALLCIAVSNDIWYMHLYADGEDFDKSHELTQEYYHRLSSEADFLMELAIELKESVPNPSTALQYLSDFSPETDLKSYDYTKVIMRCYEKISRYVNALQNFRDSNSRTDIQSRIDDILSFWRKELNYKLIRRSNLKSVMLNGFVDTGLDTYVSQQQY